MGPLVRQLDNYGPFVGVLMGSVQDTSSTPWKMLSCELMVLLEGGMVPSMTGLILSMAPSKAYSSCPMDSVSRVREDHRQAAKRKAWARMKQERIQEERAMRSLKPIKLTG